MPQDVHDALSRFAVAVRDLLTLDTLRYADPGEQNVVSELFVRLREQFPEWNVSNEYDRRERERKHLAHPDPITGTAFDADIKPDLIVHHIGTQDNLLVVEVKRHINKDIARDKWKLSGMTDSQGQYGYAAGVHLIVNVPGSSIAGCDVYVNGTVDADLTAWLRNRLQV